ncbi:UDP-N-acetylmuramoyl-L-alanine--D-glutamate ligase [Alloscardovia criceti]|uniref:UDP-N-acetylmuramoyl-L-alanine--D-glutamate ligase n=1 Tax=Alloscardovia criceti TaxID=356828 RepID=UPI0003737145|nr:UDP-N-acetylmuramoyl-L-alanine--D-glutamate ligase [Alloscardovia criceti]
MKVNMTKSYLVVGLGVSGLNVVKVLHTLGQQVTTADDNKPADYTIAQINAEDFDFTAFDAVVTSPGFKPASAFVVHAGQAGIPVISDVELAWNFHNHNEDTRRQTWIGITGTNGKTTTTEMTEAIMLADQRRAQAVGNIGNPITSAATDESLDTLVVELSSFQMHYTDSLHLHCAAITNLADDHLDWHGGFENYAADKAKVYHNAQQVIVYNADDARVSALARQAYPSEVAPGCTLVGFTLSAPQAGQIGVQDGWILDRSNLQGDATEARTLARIDSFRHLTEPDGTVYPHLLADALCALALGMGAGVPVQTAIQALQDFAPSGHRIQTVATAELGDGVIRFVDDSKATNAHAAAASLSSYADNSVVWIAGGLAKGAEFGDLIQHQKHVIKAAVIIGVDQQPMLDAFAEFAPDIPLTVIDPQTADTQAIMQQAVHAAADLATAGNVVLMAPACASMDQFVSYADRGNQFAQYAREWVNDHAK